MKGWKTWVGGIGMIATGIGSLANAILNDFDPVAIKESAVMIAAGFSSFGGLTAIGLGHKIEKNTK
jgi:hypothetical protein